MRIHRARTLFVGALAVAAVPLLGVGPAAADHTIDVDVTGSGCVKGEIALGIPIRLEAKRSIVRTRADGGIRATCHFKGLPKRIESADFGTWVRPSVATRLDSGICALQRLGLAYDNFADKVINAPMPPGTDETMRDALREQFATEAQPLKDQATEALKSAVAKGHELDVYNDCFASSLKLLRTTYAPEQFPEVPEEKLPLLAVKHAVAVEGGGLLGEIQPVPAASVQAPAKAAESQDLREDLEALTKQLRAKQASTPAESRSKNPDVKNPSDTSKKSSTDSEEPEDFL